jgi:hypothetical protein
VRFKNVFFVISWTWETHLTKGVEAPGINTVTLRHVDGRRECSMGDENGMMLRNMLRGSLEDAEWIDGREFSPSGFLLTMLDSVKVSKVGGRVGRCMSPDTLVQALDEVG